MPLGITTRAKGSAVVIGADGLPVIAYKGSGPRLTIAHCDNIECTQMSSVEVEPTNSAAYFISMTIGTDGLPIASYWARTEIDLKVAHCSDATCSEATITTLDAEGSGGADTSIVINPGGLPIISYYDDTSKNLKVCHCDDAAYSTFTISIVNDDFPEAGPTSIAIGSDGLPVITSPSKVAHCKDVKCSTDCALRSLSGVEVGSAFDGQRSCAHMGSGIVAMRFRLVGNLIGSRQRRGQGVWPIWVLFLAPNGMIPSYAPAPSPKSTCSATLCGLGGGWR